MLTHIDLFSGIGGFALAARWAGFVTEVFCENEPFCQEVLRKHWPGVPIVPDIQRFDGRKHKGATLLTGGFPCQPFSFAGRKRGKADDRYLWPEMVRVVSEARPTWIIAENVVGIAHMVLADCQDDMEALGYETQPFDIPACACGLPTMERHIWIVAAARGVKLERGGKKCLSRVKKIQPCFGGAANNGLEKFPPRPDLCRPILHRSRKGLPNFVDRHRAIGNAIVPQVAYEIIKGIAEIETRQM